MRAMLDGKRITLDPTKTLGDGGEATVFLIERGKQKLAAKVYHQPTIERARKVEALMGMSARLPKSVLGPSAFLFDGGGRDVIGFVMPLLPDGCEPVSQLSRKSFRDVRGMGKRETASVLVRLGEELARLHASGIVVGDLNDQNELFTSALEVVFIDADSFQLPGFACVVATETFLDPLLYGPDPSAPCLTDGTPRRFVTTSDWYAFAVLAFRSITGVHPYGGVLPSSPSMHERVRTRRSVFDPAVSLPKAAREGVELLTRELADVFASIFDRGSRGAFPISALATYRDEIVRCPCGLDLPATRLPCPRCHPLSSTSRGGPTSRAVDAETLLETRGPIVALSIQGDTMLIVAIEDGSPVLYELGTLEKRRELLTDRKSRAGWDVSLAVSRVAFAPHGESEGVTVALLSRSRTPFVTELAFGRASFAATPSASYRIARGTLLASRLDGEAIVENAITSVMSEQTGLLSSGEFLMASERVLSRRNVFVLDGKRRIDLVLDPPEPGEALVEESLVASPTSFAVLRVSLVAGQRLVRMAAFDRRGTIRGRSMLLASRRLAEDAIVGGVLSGDAHLVATDRGLVREDLTGASPSHLFAETAGIVGKDALLATSSKGLVVAHDGVVRAIRSNLNRT